MQVPGNVEAIASFRHSVASSDDCSGQSPLGPYLGYRPLAADDQECFDHDYSAQADDLFEMQDGRLQYGDDVGHCEIPSVAHEAVIAFLNDETHTGRLPEPQPCNGQ